MEFCISSTRPASFIAPLTFLVIALSACSSDPSRDRLNAALEPSIVSRSDTPAVVPTPVAETPAASPGSTQASAAPADSSSDPLQKLRDRINDLETRLNALNEKINLQAAEASAPEPQRQLPTELVRAAPAQAKIIPTSKTSATFASDEKVDRYREAKILYDASRFQDAAVEFVAFTKEAPDHVLAPGAQYYVGMSYLKQKEYSRAEEELNRGLVAYPHSDFVPDTLLALQETSADLGKAARVTYYQQKLSANFPNSPQAMRAAMAPQTPAVLESTHSESAPSESSVALPETPKAPDAPSAPTSRESGSSP